MPNRVPDSAEVTPTGTRLPDQTWRCRAKSVFSGQPTEPKVRGSNPLGRAGQSRHGDPRSSRRQPIRRGHRAGGQSLNALHARARRPGAGDHYAVPRCQRRQLLQRLGADRAEDDH